MDIQIEVYMNKKKALFGCLVFVCPRKSNHLSVKSGAAVYTSPCATCSSHYNIMEGWLLIILGFSNFSAVFPTKICDAGQASKL